MAELLFISINRKLQLFSVKVMRYHQEGMR